MTTAEAVQLSRRERRKLVSRERLLDAALEVFGSKGYHNAGMQEIAARADLAVGTLYNFFENKEALYGALLSDRVDHLTESLLEALDQGEDEFDNLMSYLRVKGKMYGENVEMARLYVSRSSSAGFSMRAGLTPELIKKVEALSQRLAERFRSGIDKGLFRKQDPVYMARTIAAMSNTFILLWLEDPEKNPYEENVRAMAEIFFGGVLAEDRKERLGDL